MSPRRLDATRHARAAEIFLAVVDLPSQEQMVFLARECSDDRELLEMVEQLLAEDRNGSILPEPKPAPSPTRESLTGLTLSHYRVLDRLGEGGMGTVYRAIDTRLDRTVALKFQPSQILRDAANRDRFWREAKSVASIDHPNVCPVYGMEEDGAFLFIAMAYLDGIPLDRRIASGRVSIDEALQIAIQVGRGLEAAHAKGVVHRDIKPANLMLTSTPSGDHLVRILDFGIAQSLCESAGTQDELTMGTVCYMAPEQIRPGRVDARADIWSLGVVLYEMLSGRLPFERPSVHETLDAIAGPTPADLSMLPPEVPSSLVAVIERMLDKTVARRYQSARELVADLEGVAAATRAEPPETSRRSVVARGALLALLVSVMAASVWAIWTRVAQPPLETRSIAVLPFLNASHNPEEDYFVIGMTDALITSLAQATSLRVISHTSVMQFRETTKSLPEIARMLNVESVVEGSVLRVGGRIRITAQLLDAAHDRHLWAQTYDRSESDVLALQDEVAHDISRRIAATLNPATQASHRNQPANAEAYDNYLRGRYFWNRRTLDGLEKSIEYYRYAVAIDPNYGQAYAALGDSYVLLSSYGGPGPFESLIRAREAAEKALRLDGRLAEAHTVLAAVKVDYDWDWPGATREFQRAIELDPTYPTAHHWYSLHLSRLGRNREADIEIQRALALDPLSLIINTDAGEIFYYAREPERALVQIHRTLELDPNFAEAHLVLGKIYEQKHQLKDAIAELEIGNKLFARSPNILALKAHALALFGDFGAAKEIANSLEAMSKKRYVSGVDLAIVYCALGQRDRAMSLLERAYQSHGKGMDIIGADPLLDGCHSDPRFQALLRRLNLNGTGVGRGP
jgi:serine/threonine-protein kinase